MRTEETLTLIVISGEQIMFSIDNSGVVPKYELPVKDLDKESIISTAAKFAKELGCTSHGSFHYHGKFEGSHVIWTDCSDSVESDKVRLLPKERVNMTAPMRRLLTELQSKAREIDVVT